MVADESAKGKRDDMDGVVRRTVEAFLDACTGDHRADLANPLPGDPHHVWFRLRPGVPSKAALDRSIAELEYQAEVAEWVGADVVNIHGGGAYGDKADALARFASSLSRLSDRARSRLTVENDDVT